MAQPFILSENSTLTDYLCVGRINTTMTSPDLSQQLLSALHALFPYACETFSGKVILNFHSLSLPYLHPTVFIIFGL